MISKANSDKAETCIDNLLRSVGKEGAFAQVRFPVSFPGQDMEFRSLSTISKLFFLVAVLFLDHVAHASHGPPVHITHVRPSGGSLAGGTRVIIRGSGFSTNTGGGNVIQIGPYFCDPIPLHSQPAQIACKTRSALDGAYSTWSGQTGRLPVVIFVNGKASACESSDSWGCTFMYTGGWWHTPRIYGITPTSINTGTLALIVCNACVR